MSADWQAGDRVWLTLPDRSRTRTPGRHAREVKVTGTVERTDAGGVVVQLDRVVNGVDNCYATAADLRPLV